MNKFWKRISRIGINDDLISSSKEVKKMIFFNQVLFIGLLGTFFQMFMVWPFIGWSSMVFLVAPVSSVISIILNYKGHFKFSRWFFIIMIYMLGVFTTIMLGGAGLYHLGVMSTYTFALILFDKKKEKIAHFIGLLFVVIVLLIGELGWFKAPDFSNHSWNMYFRWGNLFSLAGISAMLINFMLKLNRNTESELHQIASEKEVVLQKVQVQALELADQKISLEDLVQERTAKISSQNEVLEVQNKEKEILLQEVHHRVKNNLQIIVSLINLQRNKYETVEVKDSLKEIQSKVLSMSLVHRKMYENADYLKINLKDYCNQLVENIQLLYNDEPLDFKSDIPSTITLDTESAIPLGLILNEIVINFYKHSYSKTNNNQLELNFKKEADHFQFKCSDKGKGFPDDIHEKETGSIGLDIIDGLVGQIDGEFSFYNENGAVYQFSMLAK